MRTLVARTLLLLAGSVLSLGCGGQKPPGTVQTVPGAVVAVPAQAQAANAASTSAPKAKAKSGSAAPEKKKSQIPTNADPGTVFLVNSNGQPMEVERTKGQLTSDQFVVAAADVGNDSTKFIVESIKTGALSSQSLIGTGQPKPGFTLPKGFVPVREVGYSEEGLPMRIICTKTGTNLALVPAGTAIVGTDVGAEECKPSFTVNLDTYYMEILEVTVRDYEKYRTEMREKKKPVPPSGSNPSADPTWPVLGLTWASTQNYARWAGMELPTESEWEKAARGPNGLRTPWGEGKALWSNRSLTTTGAYPTDHSPYGILDLAGNAKEWCTDLYSSSGHVDAAAAAERETLHNWTGPKKVKDMNQRVIKGNGREWNCWHREGKDMGKSHFDVGFRCVLRIPPDAKPPAPHKASS